jgi:hypothetical protein
MGEGGVVAVRSATGAGLDNADLLGRARSAVAHYHGCRVSCGEFVGVGLTCQLSVTLCDFFPHQTPAVTAYRKS